MAESSLLQSNDEQQLLRTALEHPFEASEVPLSASTSSPSPPPPPSTSTPDPAPEATPSDPPPTSEEGWQTSYASQVSEWRAQSASARSKAELARAEWETIRARENAERQALGQPPESWDGLGDHITTSVAAANKVVAQSRSLSLAASMTSFGSAEHVEHIDIDHVESHGQSGESAERAGQGKTEGSPSQRWEHISVSPTSSFPSTSFPEVSVPHSPSHQHALLAPTSAAAPGQTHPHPGAEHNPTNVPPSILPSIMDKRVAPRTRWSLVLSSLAINLVLPFINGVMLGFGEIFAKEVVIGWFGWKSRPGSMAAGVGLWR